MKLCYVVSIDNLILRTWATWVIDVAVRSPGEGWWMLHDWHPGGLTSHRVAGLEGTSGDHAVQPPASPFPAAPLSVVPMLLLPISGGWPAKCWWEVEQPEPSELCVMSLACWAKQPLEATTIFLATGFERGCPEAHSPATLPARKNIYFCLLVSSISSVTQKAEHWIKLVTTPCRFDLAADLIFIFI